jgi:hypothetical protein
LDPSSNTEARSKVIITVESRYPQGRILESNIITTEREKMMTMWTIAIFRKNIRANEEPRKVRKNTTRYRIKKKLATNSIIMSVLVLAYLVSRYTSTTDIAPIKIPTQNLIRLQSFHWRAFAE